MSGLHQMRQHRSEKAVVGVRAFAEKAGMTCAEFELQITFFICDLGHLCDREGLDFLDITGRAVSFWKIEQTDPTGVPDPPHVTINIAETEGSP